MIDFSICKRYWCSKGGHKADEVVAYAGEMNHRKKIGGVKLNWAYAPKQVRVQISPDGVHYVPVVNWHKSLRREVAYEQNLLFDRPRNVKSIKVEMKDPARWQFFGINQINLLR